MTKQLLMATLAMLVLATVPVQAQTDTTAAAATTTKTAKAKKAKAAKAAPAESEERMAIEQLQEKVAAMQAEIDSLKEQNAAKDSSLSAAQSAAASAQSQAATAAAQAQSAAAAAQAQADAVNSMKSTVTDLQNANVGLATTISTTKSDLNDAINSPPAIHYKGVTITPVAFFAAEGVWRQHSVNSDINTPFNSIPLPSANEGHVSELNFSGRQSRLGGLFEGNAANFKLSGYFEGDFLGTGTSSNNNQSNSYVFRQRQFWGKAETNGGFAITGGQMWSLVTEDGTSTNNRTEKLPNTIDAQYMVGFSWARQPSFRVQQRFGDLKTGALTVAVAAEQAQITNFTASGTIPSDFFFAGPGQNGGLYNAAGNVGAGNTAGTGAISTYANNVSPDFIVKAVVDIPHAHFELGGLARFLRDYYYPVTTTGTGGTPTYTYGTTYVSHTAHAGGVFGSARVSPSKYVDLAVQAMAGTGVGRYGSSQLADATLRPDETLEPIRNYHGLLSIETHPTPKLDLFAYYGGEYAQRTVYATSAGNLIGYGPTNLSDASCYVLPPASGNASGTAGSISPAGCSSPTRYIQEPMVGFLYRVASSPKYGRLQYWFTYSYFQRNLWSGVGSASTPSGPRATDPMLDISMRYYIP